MLPLMFANSFLLIRKVLCEPCSEIFSESLQTAVPQKSFFLSFPGEMLLLLHGVAQMPSFVKLYWVT